MRRTRLLPRIVSWRQYARLFTRPGVFRGAVREILRRHGLPAGRLGRTFPGTCAVFAVGQGRRAFLVKLFPPITAGDWEAERHALERLADAGETAAVTRRHALHYRRFFAACCDDWTLLSDSAFRARYAPDLDSLRTAIAWSFGPDGDSEVARGLHAGVRAGAGYTLRLNRDLALGFELSWLVPLQTVGEDNEWKTTGARGLVTLLFAW